MILRMFLMHFHMMMFLNFQLTFLSPGTIPSLSIPI